MAIPSLLLASNSPRRQEMIGWLGLQFRAQPVDVDESPFRGEAPQVYVQRLAERKARAAGPLAEAGELVLAADTIVADGRRLLGKPASADHALRMLRQLRGRTHQVYTAISLYDPAGSRLATDLCASDVRMRLYSDAEILEYISTGDPLDKAGAYGIQHAGFHCVEGFDHCFASVMGFPMCHLSRTLTSWGWELDAPISALCLEKLGYACPISRRILAGRG